MEQIQNVNWPTALVLIVGALALAWIIVTWINVIFGSEKK